MSPGIPKDPVGLSLDAYKQHMAANGTSTSIAPWQNPFEQLYAKVQTSSGPLPTKTIGITVDQVSNGYIIKVRQQGTTVDRIVSDFENLGSEIMVALAEIKLGK